jgi:hypothetical protein
VFEARTKYLQVQDTPPAAVATAETAHRLLLLLYVAVLGRATYGGAGDRKKNQEVVLDSVGLGSSNTPQKPFQKVHAKKVLHNFTRKMR